MEKEFDLDRIFLGNGPYFSIMIVLACFKLLNINVGIDGIGSYWCFMVVFGFFGQTEKKLGIVIFAWVIVW